MKNYCINCKHFNPINDSVGYCVMLGIAIEKGVAILDALSTLYLVKENETGEIYSFIIVQNYFGCICYKGIEIH